MGFKDNVDFFKMSKMYKVKISAWSPETWHKHPSDALSCKLTILFVPEWHCKLITCREKDVWVCLWCKILTKQWLQGQIPTKFWKPIQRAGHRKQAEPSQNALVPSHRCNFKHPVPVVDRIHGCVCGSPEILSKIYLPHARTWFWHTLVWLARWIPFETCKGSRFVAQISPTFCYELALQRHCLCQPWDCSGTPAQNASSVCTKVRLNDVCVRFPVAILIFLLCTFLIFLKSRRCLWSPCSTT